MKWEDVTYFVSVQDKGEMDVVKEQTALMESR